MTNYKVLLFHSLIGSFAFLDVVFLVQTRSVTSKTRRKNIKKKQLMGTIPFVTLPLKGRFVVFSQ